jgi:hypothetical protein
VKRHEYNVNQHDYYVTRHDYTVKGKAVNREDKRSCRYRDRHFAKFERSRRYRDRYRC